MKKRKTSASDHPSYHAPLVRLQEVQTRWNQMIGEIMVSRKEMPEAVHSLLNGFGKECGTLLAQIAVDMEFILRQPGMKKLLASLAECKKMEIRRGSISVTEYVEKHTNRRLHTHLFFQAQDGVAFGEGLDQYKSVMEELVRRIRLLTKMHVLEDKSLEYCIRELKECSELFCKKRESILEKAGVPLSYLPQFSMLIDEALILPKPMAHYHEISLATFSAERSIKVITENMAQFFDDLHSCNTEPMLQQFRRTKTALKKEPELLHLPVTAAEMALRASA